MNQELLDVLKKFDQLGYQAIYVNPKREVNPMGLVSDGEVTIEFNINDLLGTIETSFAYMPTREHGSSHQLTAGLEAERRNVISPLEVNDKWFQEAKDWGMKYCKRNKLKPVLISDLNLNYFGDLINVKQLNLEREAENAGMSM